MGLALFLLIAVQTGMTAAVVVLSKDTFVRPASASLCSPPAPPLHDPHPRRSSLPLVPVASQVRPDGQLTNSQGNPVQVSLGEQSRALDSRIFI